MEKKCIRFHFDSVEQNRGHMGKNVFDFISIQLNRTEVMQIKWVRFMSRERWIRRSWNNDETIPIQSMHVTKRFRKLVYYILFWCISRQWMYGQGNRQ